MLSWLPSRAQDRLPREWCRPWWTGSSDINQPSWQPLERCPQANLVWIEIPVQVTRGRVGLTAKIGSSGFYFNNSNVFLKKFIIVEARAQVTWCPHGGQRTILWGHFSPSAFTRLQGLNSGELAFAESVFTR